MKDIAIEAVQLGCRYHDGTEALRDISISVRSGEAFALIGPNGAGKSTLLLSLTGLLPSTGSVRLQGELLTANSARQLRRGLALVFQDPDDQLFMPTLEEDVAFGPQNLGLAEPEVEARVRQALEQVNLWDKRQKPPHHLSQGEKRRAALATALAMQPRILLLDEPTSNLDPAARRELVEYLRGLSITRVIATHDLALARSLCERGVLLYEGRVIAMGSMAEILADGDLLKEHRMA
jgi:cobalt/nickel transport system ATP-binding protein